MHGRPERGKGPQVLPTARDLTVLSIPAGHPYVQQVRPREVRFLADPTDPWWPHPGLEPAHLASVGDQVDLVHLHFGYEHRSTREMAEWIGALDALHLPLAVTVHDLRNPHLADNTRHERHLDLLVGRADALITLTPSAATEIERRWKRVPEVVAHPPLLGPDPSRPATEAGLVGVTFKDRPGVASPGEVIGPLLTAVEATGGWLEVRFEPSAEPDLVAHATALVSGRRGTVMVAVPLDDDDFAASLARLHVAVLAYRFGTHSGWLEACRDVGTRVVAPDTGCYRDQWDEVGTYRAGPSGIDAASLTAAVRQAVERGPVEVPCAEAQRARRDRAARAHARTYRALLDQPC